jgi:hypothetical protein
MINAAEVRNLFLREAFSVENEIPRFALRSIL